MIFSLLFVLCFIYLKKLKSISFFQGSFKIWKYLLFIVLFMKAIQAFDIRRIITDKYNSKRVSTLFYIILQRISYRSILVQECFLYNIYVLLRIFIDEILRWDNYLLASNIKTIIHSFKEPSCHESGAVFSLKL